MEASKLLNHLKGVMKGHQQMLEATQTENQRKAEVEEREKQRKAELEWEKLRVDEKLQLEKVNLERLKIEIDPNLQREKLESEMRLREAETKKRDTNIAIDKFRHEVEELKAQNHSTVSMRTSVRLPKIELKKFGGQIIKWQEFWDTFEATILDNPSLQPIEKFNYLRAQLENEDLQSIAGLELTNANYEAAINLLKERYGNDQLIVDTHYAKLMEMPPASNKTTSLRAIYDAIEQHLRSLQSLGEDINQRQIVSLIRSKLPKVVTVRLEQQKGTENEWTVEMLRKSLKGYITAQEIGENQFLTNSEDDENPKAHEHKVRQFKKPFGTMSSLMSTERYKNTTPNYFYCEQPHWSDECHNFSTLQERKEKAKGRCYICLHPGNVMVKCKVEKPCYHCKEKKSHHWSLYSKLFKKKPSFKSVLTANTAPPLVKDCSKGSSINACFRRTSDNADSIN